MVPGLLKRESKTLWSFSKIALKLLKTGLKADAFKKSLKEIMVRFLFDDFERITKEETRLKTMEKRDSDIPTLIKVLNASQENEQLDNFLKKKMYELLRDFIIDNEGLRKVLRNEKKRKELDKKNKDFKILFQKPLFEYDQNDPTKLKSFGYADLFFKPNSFVDYVFHYEPNLDT